MWDVAALNKSKLDAGQGRKTFLSVTQVQSHDVEDLTFIYSLNQVLSSRNHSRASSP